MKILSDEMVKKIAREMFLLGFDKDTTLAMVHFLDSEQEAEEFLVFLESERPTDDQVLYYKIGEFQYIMHLWIRLRSAGVTEEVILEIINLIDMQLQAEMLERYVRSDIENEKGTAEPRTREDLLQQLNEIKSKTREHWKVLSFLRELKVITETEYKIMHMLRCIAYQQSIEEAEEKAKQIYEMICNCKNDEEILSYLQI